MSKKMMVNATHPEENRVAIVEDGLLTELDIEVAGKEPTKGNIYKAVVVRVEAGLQAAFVDYGAERMGFLQIDEINYSTVKPDYNPSEDGRRPRINDLLHRGQELLVQITKEERGTKGAALTTYISLAGRYMVLMPGSQTRGVSRKAESDAQRKELKKAMNSLDLTEGVGYIVRTAALDQSREELERDYRYLMRLYESIKKLADKAKAPALTYKESNLMIRSIRDYFTTDMDEVLIDDPQVFKEAKDFFSMVMPDQAKLVKLHQERRPIFSRYQIEDQIETLSRNKVALPSGGSIVIDPTEALVAIDVNSGKMASEQGVEATATKANLEAAAEVGRQLRLRDLGGLIVIDFIDMRERKNMRQVENQLKKSLENDKARVNVGRISQFGLLEMSRQRIKAALTEGSYLTCPHCQGSGHLKSPETQAVALLRKIHASAAKGQVSQVNAQLPMEVAAYLLNHKREELVDMERRYQLQIHIHGNRDFVADQIEIEIEKREKEKATQQEFVAAGSLLPEIEEESKADEPGSNDGEQENGKKRRRRRRRKPAAETGDANQATEQTPEQTSEQADKAQEEAPASTEPAADKPEEQNTDEPAKKPQRRRRSSSRAKKPADDTESAVSTDETKEPQQEAKPEGDDVPAEPAEQTKPKRRGRRKAQPQEEQTATGSATTTEATKDEATPEVATPDEAEAKPKRRGRSRRKSTTTEEVPQAETTASPENKKDPQQEEAAPSEQDEAKPKRRSGRKPKAAEASAQPEEVEAPTQGDSESASVKEQQSAADEPKVEKPKRPRRTTRKPAKVKEEDSQKTAAEPDPTQASSAEDAKEEKPKRRRTTRSKPKVADVDAEAKPEVKANATQELVEKRPAKKAPTKRTPRKSPAPEAGQTTATKDSAEQPAEPVAEEAKPKRRRTTRKKPSEETPPASDA